MIRTHSDGLAKGAQESTSEEGRVQVGIIGNGRHEENYQVVC